MGWDKKHDDQQTKVRRGQKSIFCSTAIKSRNEKDHTVELSHELVAMLDKLNVTGVPITEEKWWKCCWA